MQLPNIRVMTFKFVFVVDNTRDGSRRTCVEDLT